MSKETKVNVEEVVSDIRQTLKEIREGFDPSKLSNDDITEIAAEMDKTFLFAYQIKFKPYVNELFSTSPDLSIHEVLIKLLIHIRPHTPAKMVVKVVEHIVEKWEGKKKELVT